jgi:DNA polymerase III epsilon subunit-like protein
MNNTIVFLDTETGGLDYTSDSLLSVGMVIVDMDKEELGAELELFVKEEKIVACKKALSVNGINLDELEKIGINPQEAHQLLYDFLPQVEGKLIVGGINVNFDINFIGRLPELEEGSASRTGSIKDGKGKHITKLFSHRVIDLSTLTKAFNHSGIIKEDISTSNKLFDYFGISTEGRHGALFDAKASAICYLKMITRLKELNKVKM